MKILAEKKETKQEVLKEKSVSEKSVKNKLKEEIIDKKEEKCQKI